MSADVTPLHTNRPVSVDVRTAAELTGLSEVSIRRLVRNGTLRKVPHLGSRVLIPMRELERVFGGTT